MKKNTKKIILGLGLALIGNFAQAQGLEGIVVEKFYQSNAADASNAAANSSSSPLNAGSVTYRVYVNMAAGYKFSQIYGDASHPLQVSTTTNFFNDPNSGSTTNPSAISAANVRKNTSLIDSWFTTGGIATGKLGVLKTEDTDGSPGNQHGVLQNNPGGLFGLPINIGTTASSSAADGLISGTVVAPNVLGLTTELDVFDQTPGNNFITTNGAIAALGGVVGPTASNMVLIGQFTTDGVFSYHLNVQLVKISTGVAENYVSSNPSAGELTNASLNLVPNIPPAVSITAPTNNANIITGTSTSITANATDSDGTISQVEFFIDGVSVGVDVTSPYSNTYVATVGSHTILAKATDNSGDVTTSSSIAISVANNQAPSISLTAPSAAIDADVVSFSATASDVDGSVAQVQFYVDNVLVGTDVTSPYTSNYTAVVGTHLVKAVATDNLGLATTTSNATLTVVNNNPPTAAITSPSATASYIAPNVVTINATATDADGTVAQVEFLVNNVVVGTDVTSPYSFAWTSTPGVANIKVRSTDNKGAVTNSSVVALNIADPNALPYELGTVSQICNIPTFCVPLSAAVTAPVDNVKGYDITLHYDKTKVTPTGNISLYNDLINSALVETANTIDAVNGIMNISVFFKGAAPSNTEFNGTGKIFCVEFNKTANFQQIDTALVSISFLQESYITGVATKSVSNGKSITYRNENFLGKLKFWSDNSAIKYDAGSPNTYLITNVQGADINTGLLNPNNVKVNPSLTGEFNYTLTNGLGINIKRDINNLAVVQGLINAADVALGKDLITNVATFTPSIYQVIALDVNLDGIVSAGDISQIKQRATLSIPEFQQAWNYNASGVSNGEASRDWIFVDSNRIQNNPAYQISSTFPLNDNTGFSKAKVPLTPFVLNVPVSSYSNCPVITNETYKSIMLGDVDGSYAAFNADGVLKSGKYNGQVVLDVENAIDNGTTLDIPVSIISLTDVRALDFAFKFNEDKLSFNSIVTDNNEIDGFAHFNENDRTLRYTATDMSNFDLNKTILSVRFNKINGLISSSDINSTFGLLNGKQAEVELNKLTSGLSTLKANLVNIFPNPAMNSLNIISPENATIEILDVTGQKSLLQTEVNANEQTTFDVQNFASGIYIVKVYNNNFNKIERIVISK